MNILSHLVELFIKIPKYLESRQQTSNYSILEISLPENSADQLKAMEEPQSKDSANKKKYTNHK